MGVYAFETLYSVFIEGELGESTNREDDGVDVCGVGGMCPSMSAG